MKTFLERARIHGRFRDAAAKLEWAKRRIQELDLQSTEFLRSHWVFYERRSTGPLHERLLSIRYTKPVPLRFGLMIGDVANNLRSALDHMVWEVVGPYKPKNAKAVQFPFAERPQDLSKKIKTHFIYLAGPEAERIVGLHQGDLFGLDQLNNKDKHRLITVLGDVAEIRGLKGEEGNPHKPYVRFEGLNMSHAPGDVRDLMLGGFGAGRIKGDENGVVDQGVFDMTIHLVFADGGPFARVPVVSTLNALAETAEKVLVEFHNAFPSMFASGYFKDNPDPL